MLVPISWLKEYVDIDIPAELLAERLTVAGLEVGHLHYVGLPQTFVKHVRWPVSDHLVWDREKILLAAIREVKPHPNADRLVLAMVDYGGAELEQCVTGAPNLFEFKGKGPLDPPLWTAFAAEGAEVWDGHSDEPKRMILKEKALRGIPNRSMVCSEKELGLSDQHDGVITMFEDPGFAPGTPLQDVLGDIILEIDLLPNMARAFSIYGVAREVAALLDVPLRPPSFDYLAEGDPIDGAVNIEIREPSLNPRFTLALLRDVTIKPSPEWMQRRLQLVGQRPINNIVDVTNYITFEIGQPLHAFDYDKLHERASGAAPTIITRLPAAGETLTTLDEVARTLEPHNILVTDTAGVLSLGGIIGGAETEIGPTTKTVLLEAANWYFINIRRTMQSQKVFTDAGGRFSRGVHPSQAILGLQRGIELMRQFSGGVIARGLIDEYPNPPEPVTVDLPISEVRRLTGVEFTLKESAAILTRAGFGVKIAGDALNVSVPETRLDIGAGIVGQADLIEEIARIHGYGSIPNTIMADAMPPQRANPELELEEQTRDLLVALGLRENISYRLTTKEREAMLIPPGMPSSLPMGDYVELANPISADKAVLRHTLLANLLENARGNSRFSDRQQIFEIGAIYLKHGGSPLPEEPRMLALLLTGARDVTSWIDEAAEADRETPLVDYFDLKGVVEALLDGLHISGARYSRAEHTSFHPGRSALLSIESAGSKIDEIGVFGELHPLVSAAFGLEDAPVLAAEFNLDKLLTHAQEMYAVQPLPVTPPVLQDIALVVKQETTAAEVEAVIVRAGGDLLRRARLFDVYQGDPIPAGHKSLAYSLTYQTDERTLTDKEVARVHDKIVRTAERELGAKLRA